MELSQEISEKKMKLYALRKWNQKSCLSAASGMAAHQHYLSRQCRSFLCKLIILIYKMIFFKYSILSFFVYLCYSLLIYLLIYLSICLFLSLFFYFLFICLFVYLFICLFVYLFISFFIYLFVYLYIY